jgi:hypothetical protein
LAVNHTPYAPMRGGVNELCAEYAKGGCEALAAVFALA